MVKKIIVYILTFLCCILIVLWSFEQRQQIQNGQWEGKIGINVPCTRYAPNVRSDHISCLETYHHPDGAIRFLDLGEKNNPAIVLLHGTPTNSRLYRKMALPLVDAGYRVIVPDMLGFGASAMIAPEQQFTVQQAERIVQLLNHLAIPQFALGGHDQGSLWMWSIAITYPEKITHLFVFNSISIWEGFHPPAGFGKKNITTQFTAWAMKSMLLGRIFAYGALLGGVQNLSVVTHSMVNGYLLPLLQQKNNSYRQFISNFNQIRQEVQTFGEKMNSLQFPITIIWGAGDPILQGSDQIPILQERISIPEKNIFILNDAKHFIQEEMPERIIEIILSQLALSRQ